MTFAGVLSHWATLHFSMIAAIVMVAVVVTLLRQRRSPGSSVAWLMAIVLVPPIGIPAFFIFGGSRFRKIVATKPAIPLATSTTPVPTDGWSDVGAQLAGGYGLSAPSGGNTIRLHPDGETAFADLLTLIDNAKRSISIEMYILKNDATGKIVIEHLMAQAKKGIAVRLLIDGLGAFSMSRLALWRLRKAGGKTAFFRPVWRLAFLARTNLRNHRKIVVVDDERVFAGGRNLAAEYLGPKPDAKRWRDLSFVLEGPSVADYNRIFRYDWAFATHEQLETPPVPAGSGANGGVMQVVPAGPDVADDALFAATLSALFQARERIWIVTPYFVPDDSLKQALVIASRRGVDVRIVVPDSSEQMLTDLARGPYLRELVAAGAKVMLLTGTLVHAKVVLIDDEVAMVGSANFDSRSMFLNFEVMSLLYSPAEIRTVAAWVETLQPQTIEGGKPVSGVRDTLESLAYLIAPQL